MPELSLGREADQRLSPYGQPLRRDRQGLTQDIRQIEGGAAQLGIASDRGIDPGRRGFRQPTIEPGGKLEIGDGLGHQFDGGFNDGFNDGFDERFSDGLDEGFDDRVDERVDERFDNRLSDGGDDRFDHRFS